MKKSTIILLSVFGGIIIAKGVLDLLGYNSFYSRYSAQRTQAVKQLVEEAKEIADKNDDKRVPITELSDMLKDMGYHDGALKQLEDSTPYVFNITRFGRISVGIHTYKDPNSERFTPPIQIKIPEKKLREYVKSYRQ